MADTQIPVFTLDKMKAFKTKQDVFNEGKFVQPPVSADKVSYGDGTVKDAIDQLLYVPVNITSFSNNVNNVENGATVTDVKLSWNVAGTPNSIKLNNTDQALDSKGATLTGQSIKTNTTWTLTATDAKGAKSTKTTGIYFKNKRYWGAAADAAIDSAFILALSGNGLADNLKGDYSMTVADNQHAYFAAPASWGDSPSFWVGGFEGGFSKTATLDFTNASGAVVSYNVFKSTNSGLGAITVTVK